MNIQQQGNDNENTKFEKLLDELRSKIDLIKEKIEKKSFWNSNFPLVIAIFAAAIGAFGNMYIAHTNSNANIELERLRIQQQLLVEAVTLEDLERAKKNIKFLLDTKLLREPVIDVKAIRKFIFTDQGEPLIITPKTSSKLPVIGGFGYVKKRLTEIHKQIGHSRTLYCDCPYTKMGTSAGIIDQKACGLKMRKNRTRSKRMEWEHVVPISWFGRTRKCWNEGHALCVTGQVRELLETFLVRISAESLRLSPFTSS